jgi:cation transport ATPase
MQNHSLRRILGQPALHILVALGFAVAFAWPIFVLTQPRQTFYFLYAAWLLAIVASLALSRGQPPEQSGEAAGSRATAKGRNARGAGEAR